jgi:adenylyltransferase/sulfurtransferase
MSDGSLERYNRQMRFAGIGEEGQRRLLAGRAVLCGCGALGTVIANTLARAGVGHIRIIDRDFVERSNLQRQVLFDERDIADNLPKSVAAARKLTVVNSLVRLEPVVADLDRTNIMGLVEDADVILDGTDNFEIRYLINDVALKLGKPWVYGGCLASHGQTMTILPGRTPCLRCVFEAAPAPGEGGTCETAGVLAPAVNIVASYQAMEAIKILCGRLEAVNRDLIYIDVWENVCRHMKIAPLRSGECPCCGQRRFEWLDGVHGSQTTRLCGRNAVQVAQRNGAPMRFPALAESLRPLGAVHYNDYLLKFATVGYEFTVFADGRAIIKGTDDLEKARVLYARYIGH